MWDKRGSKGIDPREARGPEGTAGEGVAAPDRRDVETPALSVERRGLAGAAVLALTPVLACGLWAIAAHGGGHRGKPAAAAVILAASLVTLLAVAPHALRGAAQEARRPGSREVLHRASAVAWVPLALVAARAVAGELWMVSAPVLLGTGAFAGVAFRHLAARVPTSFDGRARRHPVLVSLWVLSALAAISQVTRLSVFMADPSQVLYSVIPGSDFFERHSCLTAYVHAAGLARDGYPNIYDLDFVKGDPLTSPLPPTAQGFAPFTLDTYGYPPPFLLLPRALLLVSTDFTVHRALWYVLSAAAMAVGLAISAEWLGGRARHRLIALLPLYWGAAPVLLTLQMGNFQVGTVFLAILAMIAFDRGRTAIGGALLAFATLSKFSPVLLIIMLLAQRNVRAVVSAAASGVVLCLAVIPVFGVAPWRAFLRDHLPALQSGRAHEMLDDSLINITSNFSVFGIPFKLQQLGLSVGWDLARTIGDVYSALLPILAVLAGLRLLPGNRFQHLSVWLALVTLGALRSPLAPLHVLVGALWLLVLVSADVKSKRQALAFAVVWILLTVLVPIDSPVPAVLVSLLRQSVLIFGLAWVALRRYPVATAEGSG